MLSSFCVVGSQAPLGAGFGNPFASAVGTSLGSSTLGGITSDFFQKPKKTQYHPFYPPCFLKTFTPSLIAFNAEQLFFPPVCFQCGETVVGCLCV